MASKAQKSRPCSRVSLVRCACRAVRQGGPQALGEVGVGGARLDSASVW